MTSRDLTQAGWTSTAYRAKSQNHADSDSHLHLRILQEAFTNILKHAHANTVKLETGIAGEPGKVFVSVSDNGIGVSNDHAGHGFTNMRRRAQAIGGTLDIVSAATGTMITLSLPNA